MVVFDTDNNIHGKTVIFMVQKMKKLAFLFLVLILLVVSGCKDASLTGKSVVDAPKDSANSTKIGACVELCNDGSMSVEEFYNSCSKILEFGGDEVLNDYVNSCEKTRNI